MMKNNTISNKVAAYNGALVTVAGVFAYSLLVMLYTIIRSSATIISIMPAGERSTILWANGFSVAYAVIVFSLLMSAASSVAGAVAGIILKKVLLRFNPQRHFSAAILVSSITAIVLLAALYLLLYLLLKERITCQYPETVLFWYGFPTIVFFISIIISGVKLNIHFTQTKSEQIQNHLQ
jgi:hypothetical protein